MSIFLFHDFVLQFYCQDCVIGGDFVDSSSALCERFCEKQLRYFSLQRDITNCKQEISALATKKWNTGHVKENIKVTRTKIKYLKHVIQQNKDRKAQNSELLTRYRESVRKRRERLPLFKEKVDKMESFVEKFLVDMESKRQEEERVGSEIRRTQSDWILRLHDHVFPVEHLETVDSWPQEADTSDRMMMECLADAMRTSYISGRWVNSDYRDTGDQYRIVTPVSELSSIGPCSPDLTQHHTAAVHTLAAQFVSLVAGVLHLPLPVKLSWSDLGLVETKEERLARKVGKLNINLIRLCLECGVDIRVIRPNQCLHNLFNMITTLRRHNTVTVSHLNTDDMLHTLQSQLDSDDTAEADTDTDDDHEDGVGGAVASGWESVSSEQVVSVDPGHQSIASSVSNTVSQFLWGYSNTPQHSPLINKKQ